MTQIAEIEQKILAFKFPGYGCLYHERDVEGQYHLPLQVGDFCIGPVASRQFWHDERGKMDLDRGPWNSSEYCLTSAARRELFYLQHHAKPKPRQTFLLPTDYDIDPGEHASLLSSIIDWQDATIFPLFMQAGYPAFCEHDSSRPQSLKIPTLPNDFPSMGEKQQMEAMIRFRLEEANIYYTAATGMHNEAHLNALRIPHLGIRQYLTQQTAYPWDADVVNLLAALVSVTAPSVWSNVSPLPCPVSFSKEEIEHAMDESSQWNESEALLTRVRDELGIDLEGGTEPDNFEWASQKNLQLRVEMARQSDAHERETCWRNWPYKDDGDLSSSPQFD